MILSRNGAREEKITKYHVGKALNTKLTQNLKSSQLFARVVVRSLLSRGGLPEDSKLIQKIPIYLKF